MRRECYLHKRQSGIYYVEFIDKVSGKKLTARSTGKQTRQKPNSRQSCGKPKRKPLGLNP